MVFTIDNTVCINYGQAGTVWLKASGLQKPFIRQNIVRVQFLEGDQELVMEIGPSWV